ncbi:tyrosine-type recombinase/integrase [Sphingomonas qilianensis]|uniref:Integrase arm-type DNA-binding domain-containing protein n=1 Tax=Sphingomonas qilianensis TaxID=1736690 RepID=A0ABU9XR16_9SPHN
MAQQFNRLNAISIKRPMVEGRHPDGNNLYLNVSRSGAKSWALIYTLNGKRREVGLGKLDLVPLAEARNRAREAADLRRQGLDPKAIWDAQKAPASAASAASAVTFGELALEVVNDRKAAWKNAKHVQQWENSLFTYAAPIWATPVSDIDIEDVLTILRPIWTTKQETASRLRGRIQAVLDVAKVRGLRTGENPAVWAGNLALVLAKQRSGPMRHQPSMPHADLREFMIALRKRREVSARALELTILTAGRTTEIREAVWEEFDLPNATWCIPADRMKMARDHRVALSKPALALLEALDAKSGLLFPGQKAGKSLSNMTMLQLMRRMNVGHYCVHGFRSSFSTWAAEKTDFQRELVEVSLAHVVGSEVARAYQRSDILEKRVALMQAWADYIL